MRIDALAPTRDAKLFVAGVAALIIGLVAVAGWNFGLPGIDPRMFLTVWVVVGLVAAAGYALSWPGERRIVSWLALPLTDRALIMRLTSGDRWGLGGFAVLAGVFGAASGIAAGRGLGGIVEAALSPAIVAFGIVPLGLLLLRLGRAVSWIWVALSTIGTVMALIPEVGFLSSARERYEAGLVLLLVAAVGWAFLGHLPGRSRLRRLAFGQEALGRPRARKSHRKPACRQGRNMAIAGLLLESSDPRRQLRRLAWLTPWVAMATWATWWLQAHGVDSIPAAMPAVLIVAVAGPMVFGWGGLRKDETRLRAGRPAAWGLRIDPMPVSPREVLHAGLSIRLVFALAVLVLSLPAIVLLCRSAESQAFTILFVGAFLPLPLYMSASELRGISSQRLPPQRWSLSPGATWLFRLLLVILVALPWLLISGHLQPLIDDLAHGLLPWIAIGHRVHQLLVGTWLADGRFWAATAGIVLMSGAISSLRRTIRDRETRCTDIWP